MTGPSPVAPGSAPLVPRVRAVCDLSLPEVREYAGRHEYDGEVQDLSPDGVRRGLAALAGPGDAPLDDLHDEAHLAAFEALARARYVACELHRWNPLPHVTNLELSSYDRAYAPPDVRVAARRRHLARWPEAVEAAVDALDRVPRAVASALLPTARGLAGDVQPGEPGGDAALVALDRLVTHLQVAAETGTRELPLGVSGLATLMGSGEAAVVDLTRLAERAERERDRMRDLLREACERLDPGASVEQVVTRLRAQHPEAQGLVDRARSHVADVVSFSAQRGLVPYDDVECLVGATPPSRAWAMATVSAAAPNEPDAPSWYYVSEPDARATRADQLAHLSFFNDAVLPAITAHEVSPGHVTHMRALRRVASPVRRVLISWTFFEGWAHYAEELLVEHGFRGGDPHYAAGVALGALLRVTRLAAAIGLHSGALTAEAAARRFVSDACLAPATAAGEVRRGLFDPTYGNYTWGKLAVRDAREATRASWGAAYSDGAFHAALLSLGSPPLGLLSAVCRAPAPAR